VIRYVVAVALLSLLIPSNDARSEDLPQPVPANGKCSVPADPQWTPQEKFVWRRVCIGEVADFNKAPGYGGDIDPKSPQGLPDSRILRSAFIETILLKDKYRHALTRRGVVISGARFTETVDLEGAQLEDDFGLFRSLLGKGADLILLRSTHVIALSGSKVIGMLKMNGLQIDQSLLMRNTAEIGQVDLTSAHVGGQLDMNGSQVTGMLNMIGLQANKDLLMYSMIEFDQVYLRGPNAFGARPRAFTIPALSSRFAARAARSAEQGAGCDRSTMALAPEREASRRKHQGASIKAQGAASRHLGGNTKSF
jgi:hypothetical protein